MLEERGQLECATLLELQQTISATFEFRVKFRFNLKFLHCLAKHSRNLLLQTLKKWS